MLDHPYKSKSTAVTGSSYTLSISSEWADLKGTKLERRYSKKFVTGTKDIQSPDPLNWQLNVPSSGSRQALTISLNESLDHTLLFNTIAILNSNGDTIEGKFFSKNQERSLLFYPKSHWIPGTYILRIDSKLEDLAGNNLNRLFDRDLLKDKPAGRNEFHNRQFIVK